MAGLTGLAGRLQDLTKEDTPFNWKKYHQISYDEMKRILINTPIIALWQQNKTTVSENDAPGLAIGGCMSQYNEAGQLHPIAHFSKKLSPEEYNYDIHDKELLAVILCLKEWRAELLGVDSLFVILIDHKNLQYFMASKKIVEKQIRWLYFLSEFNFKFRFRAGKFCHGQSQA